MFYKIIQNKLVERDEVDINHVCHDDGWYSFDDMIQAKIFFGILNELAEKEYDYVL